MSVKNTMPVRIKCLNIKEFKKIRLLELKPSLSGLTVIGGRNNQGKTSALDAILYALGGGKFKPSDSNNNGSGKSAKIKIELDNGLIVERKGKNGSLKVTSQDGLSGGQAILDKFIEILALNISQFMGAKPVEKAKILLKTIGVGDQLEDYDIHEADLYLKRSDVSRIVKQIKAELQAATYYEDAPDEKVSVVALMEELERAEDKQRLFDGYVERAKEYSDRQDSLRLSIDAWEEKISEAQAELRQLAERRSDIGSSMDTIVVPDIESIKERVLGAEGINEKVMRNEHYSARKDALSETEIKHDKLESDISVVRKERQQLLSSVDMPLDGLSIVDGELTYNNQKWDCMSGSEQLIVATSIVQAVNPDCGFVLLDKAEGFDLPTLNGFGDWAEENGLQVITTRVSIGEECSIIIEDGIVVKDGEDDSE